MARIKISYPEKTLFSHDLSVRVTDLNYGNHLAHDSIISLMHEARAQFFAAKGMSELDIEGAGIIMADLAINYRAEAHFGQLLTIEITLDEFSKKGCDMFYRVLCKESGVVVAIAKTGLVFFDYSAKKPVTVPASFLKIASVV
jgi:YbgC/YbaW family acyl-CoA thioester hydrolase